MAKTPPKHKHKAKKDKGKIQDNSKKKKQVNLTEETSNPHFPEPSLTPSQINALPYIESEDFTEVSETDGPNTATTSMNELNNVGEDVQDVLVGDDFAAHDEASNDKMNMMDKEQHNIGAQIGNDGLHHHHLKNFEESSDGSQDCMACYRIVKHRIKPENTDKAHNCERVAHFIVKWLVFIIALGNYFQSFLSAFQVLQNQMKMDYLFALRIFNCKEWIVDVYRVQTFMYAVHGLTSVVLLYGNSKETAIFCVYWIASQIMLSTYHIVVGFFQFRFGDQDKFNDFVLTCCIFSIVEAIEISIVLLRYYLLDRPYQERLQRLATGGNNSRTINGDLFLRASVFLQMKAAVRDAANFQTIGIIRKLAADYNKSGMQPPDDVTQKEVESSINAMKETRKYPGLKRMNQAKRRRVSMAQQHKHAKWIEKEYRKRSEIDHNNSSRRRTVLDI